MSPGRSVVTITISDTKSFMPSNFEYDYLLHPATLDTCFHGLLAATAYANTNEKHVAIVSETPVLSFPAELWVLILLVLRSPKLRMSQYLPTFPEALATSSLASYKPRGPVFGKWGQL